METIVHCLVLVSLFSATAYATTSYTIPEARVEVFEPKGLHVSIPDADGIRLFAFHGNVNNQINDLEAGQMSKDVLIKTPDGRWTYKNDNLSLKKGDVLSYWLYVLKDRLGFLLTEQTFVVGDRIPKPAHSSNDHSKLKPHKGHTTTHRPSQGYQPQSPITDEAQQSLESCLRVVDNSLESLKTANAEIRRLREQNKYLQNQVTNKTVSILPQGLLLGGNLPKIIDTAALHLVNFILWEKLNLVNLEAKSAVINPGGTITFEMDTPDEKLQILTAVKKALKNSTIYIKDVENLSR